jgi:hypothetical protein
MKCIQKVHPEDFRERMSLPSDLYDRLAFAPDVFAVSGKVPECETQKECIDHSGSTACWNNQFTEQTARREGLVIDDFNRNTYPGSQSLP